MKILAIETSCDDTAVAILQVEGSKFKVLANIVSSQSIHQNYGGVFPMMAKREHQNNLVPVLMQALKQAKLLNPNSQSLIPNEKLKTIQKILEKENILFESVKEFLEKHKKPNVDLIAVTNGPGLEPCLWVGVNFARVLSYYWEIPMVPVNHIEAHIAVNFLQKIDGNPKQIFPAVALVVSGGHTQLILVKGIGKYEIIGETRDDAAGECFDKCAKILGLGYPGGPEIARIANQHLTPNTQHLILPRPMINSKDYDFSFSGLKTAVLYKARENKLTDDFVKQMCVEIQQAIIDVLLKKTMAAAKNFKVKTIILGGGVSANSELRSQLELRIKNYESGINFLVPPKNLSTDNALMIAVVGYFDKAKKQPWQKLKANANLRVG